MIKKGFLKLKKTFELVMIKINLVETEYAEYYEKEKIFKSVKVKINLLKLQLLKTI